jgi:hypothetical protein
MSKQDIARLADEIAPFLLRYFTPAAQGTTIIQQSGGIAVHDIGGPYHSGTLDDDQAPQFLKTDGTRQLTGNLSVANGVTIDGVDLSAHAANPSAHHAPVTAGTLIALSGQQVSVANGTAQYQVPVTGASPFAPSWTALSSFAGNGLVFSGGQFAVGAGAGLTVDADTVALTTPGTLNVSTTNSAAGNHTHAIATISDASGGQTGILASSGGALALTQLTATNRVRTPLLDTAAGASMTISPALDLILNPGSGIVRMASGDAIQASTYASQTTGWRITDFGEGDFRYLFADEMHVKSFIADLEQALAGGQIIAKSVAVLAQDFTLPTAGNSATLRVRDLPSAPNMAVFQSGDFIGLRQFSRSGGSLSVAWAWGTVTNYADGAGENEGTQTWTFTRHSGTPGTASGIIPADSLVLDFGVSGNGFYEVNAIDGVYGQNSPYAQVVTWATHPATQTVRARLGNLRGITGVTDEFGFWAGSGTSPTSRFIRASSSAIEIRNVPLALFDGTNNTLLLSAGSGNNAPHLAMGSPLPTSPTGGAGLWMGLSGGAYHFRVGDPAGQRLHWNGSSLTVVGSVTIQSGSGYGNLTDRPTSLYAVNPVEHAQLVTGRKVFVETFDDPNSIAQWESFSGNGEMSVASTADAAAGGRILRIGDNAGNDQRWLIHRRLIPYKANTLYKMTIRIRRTAGTGKIYVGMAGVAADGATWVNTAGSNTATLSQHYFVASDISPPPTFTIYTGYLLGWGSPNGGVSGGFYRAHADVRYIRPLIIVNHFNVAGTTDIDFVEIEEYDYPGSAGLYLTPLYSGYWDGSAWRSYFDNNGNFYLNAGAGSNFLSWDGTTLTVNGTINVVGGNAAKTDLSNSVISTLINGSSIRVGSGTKNIDLNGWNIDNTEIVAQENGVTQVQFNSSSGIGLIANNTEPTAPAMRTIDWGTAFPVTSSNIVASIRSYFDSWNQIAVTAHNLSTTRGARTRFGNRINGMFSAGIRVTSSYVSGAWSHSIDAYGDVIVNNNLNVLGNTYVANLDSTAAVGSAWTTLTLATGWANNGSGWATAQYCQFGDWVMLKGLVQATQNQAAFATITTLPDEIRPAQHRAFATSVGNSAARLDVLSTGVVRVSAAVNSGNVVSIECIYKR